MFPIVFEVELEGVMTNRDTRRMQKILKLGLRAMLFDWHLKFFKRHFERGAYFRYGSVYSKRKDRRSRANKRPNVRTGRMKRMLEQSFRVTGTVKKMTATMTGPPYTDVRGKGQPDKAREIAFINAKEQSKLARFYERFVARTIQKDTRKSRIKIAA